MNHIEQQERRDEAPATIGEAVAEWAAYAPEEDPKRCPCHGSGWMLSDYDTWHRCYVHNNGHIPHPEDETVFYCTDCGLDDLEVDDFQRCGPCNETRHQRIVEGGL